MSIFEKVDCVILKVDSQKNVVGGKIESKI